MWPVVCCCFLCGRELLSVYMDLIAYEVRRSSSNRKRGKNVKICCKKTKNEKKIIGETWRIESDVFSILEKNKSKDCVVGGRAPPIHNLGLAPILRGIIEAADSSSITLHFTSKLQRKIFSFPSTDRTRILQNDWKRGDEKEAPCEAFLCTAYDSRRKKICVYRWSEQKQPEIWKYVANFVFKRELFRLFSRKLFYEAAHFLRHEMMVNASVLRLLTHEHERSSRERYTRT
jgi:hypothetical protein